jgi:hypothetical protein
MHLNNVTLKNCVFCVLVLVTFLVFQWSFHSFPMHISEIFQFSFFNYNMLNYVFFYDVAYVIRVKLYRLNYNDSML